MTGSRQVSITPLQAKVLDGLLGGMRPAQIARDLAVHPSYVAGTRARLIRAFRVGSVLELLAAAAVSPPAVHEAAPVGLPRVDPGPRSVPPAARAAAPPPPKPVREVKIDATKTCLWLDGDPRRGLRTCDAPVIRGKPFCAEHCKRVYLPREREETAAIGTAAAG